MKSDPHKLEILADIVEEIHPCDTLAEISRGEQSGAILRNLASMNREIVDRFSGKPVDRVSDRLPHFNGLACDHCGGPAIDHCARCGAPQCCPKCCAESSVENTPAQPPR